MIDQHIPCKYFENFDKLVLIVEAFVTLRHIRILEQYYKLYKIIMINTFICNIYYA